MTQKIQIEGDATGARLDAWVASHSGLSRSAFKRLVEAERVRLDGQLVRKAGMKIACAGTLSIEDEGNAGLHPQPMALDIVYEDTDLLIVNKPRGLLVYPVKDKEEASLAGGLLAYTTLSDYCGSERPGIVHRIDRDTSGLVLVAKNNRVHALLYEALAAHAITREYIGICCGAPDECDGTIRKNIAHDYAHGTKRIVCDTGGQEAITHYACVYRNADYSLMRFQLETGRTHQIRVHMASLGHPLVGDGLYGTEKNIFGFRGQALHALCLRFTHPLTGAPVEAVGKPPEIFKKAVTRIQMMK